MGMRLQHADLRHRTHCSCQHSSIMPLRSRSSATIGDCGQQHQPQVQHGLRRSSIASSADQPRMAGAITNRDGNGTAHPNACRLYPTGLSVFVSGSGSMLAAARRPLSATTPSGQMACQPQHQRRRDRMPAASSQTQVSDPRRPERGAGVSGPVGAAAEPARCHYGRQPRAGPR